VELHRISSISLIPYIPRQYIHHEGFLFAWAIPTLQCRTACSPSGSPAAVCVSSIHPSNSKKGINGWQSQWRVGRGFEDSTRVRASKGIVVLVIMAQYNAQPKLSPTGPTPKIDLWIQSVHLEQTAHQSRCGRAGPSLPIEDAPYCT